MAHLAGTSTYKEVTAPPLAQAMHGVWGDISSGYTYDSNVDSCVVHAGILRPGERGLVKVTYFDGNSTQFKHSLRNGVQSVAYPPYVCGMHFDLVGTTSLGRTGLKLPTLDTLMTYFGRNKNLAQKMLDAYSGDDDDDDDEDEAARPDKVADKKSTGRGVGSPQQMASNRVEEPFDPSQETISKNDKKFQALNTPLEKLSYLTGLAEEELASLPDCKRLIVGGAGGGSQSKHAWKLILLSWYKTVSNPEAMFYVAAAHEGCFDDDGTKGSSSSSSKSIWTVMDQRFSQLGDRLRHEIIALERTVELVHRRYYLPRPKAIRYLMETEEWDVEEVSSKIKLHKSIPLAGHPQLCSVFFSFLTAKELLGGMRAASQTTSEEVDRYVVEQSIEHVVHQMIDSESHLLERKKKGSSGNPETFPTVVANPFAPPLHDKEEGVEERIEMPAKKVRKEDYNTRGSAFGSTKQASEVEIASTFFGGGPTIAVQKKAESASTVVASSHGHGNGGEKTSGVVNNSSTKDTTLGKKSAEAEGKFFDAQKKPRTVPYKIGCQFLRFIQRGMPHCHEEFVHELWLRLGLPVDQVLKPQICVGLDEDAEESFDFEPLLPQDVKRGYWPSDQLMTYVLYYRDPESTAKENKKKGGGGDGATATAGAAPAFGTPGFGAWGATAAPVPGAPPPGVVEDLRVSSHDESADGLGGRAGVQIFRNVVLVPFNKAASFQAKSEARYLEFIISNNFCDKAGIKKGVPKLPIPSGTNKKGPMSAPLRLVRVRQLPSAKNALRQLSDECFVWLGNKLNLTYQGTLDLSPLSELQTLNTFPKNCPLITDLVLPTDSLTTLSARVDSISRLRIRSAGAATPVAAATSARWSPLKVFPLLRTIGNRFMLQNTLLREVDLSSSSFGGKESSDPLCIGDSVFQQCWNLRKVSLRGCSVKEIGTDFCHECPVLQQVLLPDAANIGETSELTAAPAPLKIGQGFLCECPQLRELIIPNKFSVEVVDWWCVVGGQEQRPDATNAKKKQKAMKKIKPNAPKLSDAPSSTASKALSRLALLDFSAMLRKFPTEIANEEIYRNALSSQGTMLRLD